MSLADFDRPLNSRGQKAAPFMGELLARNGYAPDLIISSPAKRAIDTGRAVALGGGFDCPIDTDHQIYEASVMRLLDVTTGIDDLAGSALLVGHNPGMEGFVSYLSGEFHTMPTAAVAIFEIDVRSWSQIDPSKAVLVAKFLPRNEMA